MNMNETWREIISLAVVPVVIISACGLLCLTFYNRLAFLVTRLRMLQKERLQEYKEVFLYEKEKKPKVIQKEAELYLKMLEDQTAKVLKRAGLLRNCLISLIGSTASLVVTSLLIGLGRIHHFFGFAAIFFFILGLFLLLIALFFAFKEILHALKPIEMESQFMQKLLKSELESSFSDNY